ncbi:MAG TPA: NUDIX domain-containing protein [Pseudolabrys sp.]|jgi:ADP-ribose pyrophosphatase YjhB (NUDIX family)|nr:NUDIX domain-containing protein [Pseudolabrys sp.]
MVLDKFRRAGEPAIRRLLHTYWRFSRAATLGVRAMIVDDASRIFLVKHSYVDGWHLPGGGVETGETLLEALRREVREEGNIEIVGTPALHAVYFNRRVSRRDHVALFIVRDFRQEAPPQPGREIIAHGFFARGALPDGTTSGTRARIAEVFGGATVSENW